MSREGKNRRYLYAISTLLIMSLLLGPIYFVPYSSEFNDDKKIIFIYNQNNSENVISWASLLEKYQYQVTTITIENVLSNPSILLDFNLIIMDNATDNLTGDLLTFDEIKTLVDQGIPIIANGFSGWIILKLSELQEFFLYDSTSKIKILPEDINSNLFISPFQLYLENSTNLFLLPMTDSFFNTSFFLSDSINQLDIFGYRYSSCAFGKYSGYENNTNIFFSFINNPDILNENGENFYVNLIEFIINDFVTRVQPDLSIESEELYYFGQEILIHSTLSYNQTPIPNKKIYLIVNNTFVASEYTNQMGFVELSLQPNETGIIYIKSYFEGDNYFLNASSNIKIVNILDTINNNSELIPTNIGLLIKSIDNLTNIFNIKINLSDNFGNLIGNKEICLFLNKQFQHKFLLNESGEYFFSINISHDLIKVNISLLFEGDEIYESSCFVYIFEINYDKENENMINTSLVLSVIILSSIASSAVYLTRKYYRF